jgi:SAM-dependent methyltransferase
VEGEIRSMTSPDEDVLRAAYAGEDVAADYSQRRFGTELNRLLHDRQVAAVQRAIQRLRPLRMLEIAPGPARVTADVKPSGVLACLEYSDAMIVRGRTASPPAARWVRGDAFHLPFRQCFGLTYSFRFVRHFRRDDRMRLYAEVWRVLEPGGHFLLDAVNERVSRPLRTAHPDDYPHYDELYRPVELRDELAAAGFELTALEPLQRWYALQYRSQVFIGPRAAWLNRQVIRALERLPRREGLEWIVTCRRA